MSLSRLIREPTLHFALLGGALFWVYGAAREREVEPIRVSEALVEALSKEHAVRAGAPPDAAALRGLATAWAAEEALYREALRLELHRGDPVVRRRLVQKMEFLAEDAVPDAPDEATLAAWLAEHPDRFRRPPRYTVRHLYFGDDAAEAQAALARLEAGGTAEGLGRAFAHGLRFSGVGVDRLRRLLGQRFAQAVEIPGDGWRGPIRSSYGLHLVRVEAASPGGTPALAEVRSAVAADWAASQRAEARARLRARALERYPMKLPAEWAP